MVSQKCPSLVLHLARRGTDVGAGVGLGHQVLPFALVVEAPGGEVAVHAAASAAGIRVHVGVGVELREPLLHGELADGEHEGHVAVIATAPIAIAELLGHGHLGQFLAIAEDAELGFAGEHFLATQQTGLAALGHNAVVAEDLLADLLQRHHLLGGVALGLGHGEQVYPAKVRLPGEVAMPCFRVPRRTSTGWRALLSFDQTRRP
ncbi:MAG: hypothetical protein MUE88_11640 [Flavobacteriales bacterium]|nr:hypothetical protein [Flavobacteriales bacterium]